MTKKFFDMIGYDPATAQGPELTDVFDTEKVVAARQQYDAAVSSFDTEQESLETDAVEFFNPISQEGLDQLRNNSGGLVFPGVRLRKVDDFTNQNFLSFISAPVSVIEERVRLGGGVFSNPFSSYDPSGKDLDVMIEKYNLDTEITQIEKLLDAESPEDLEARAVVLQRRQQRMEQIAIDNQGVLGLAGMMGMSLLDPSLYLTGGAATGVITTRLLHSTTRTGAALRFTADGLTRKEAFFAGAGGYAIGEAPIELANAAQDPDFDPGMTLAFMALAPLVGGAFNALGNKAAVDSAEFAAAIALDEQIANGIINPDFRGTDGGAGGAAQRGALPITVDEDGIPGAPPRSSGWTFGTPLNFLARSADPIVRSVASRLSNNPWTGGSRGTTAFEAQRRIYNAQSVALRDLRLAAKEFFGSGVMSPSTAQLDDFFRQVGQHVEGYNVSTNPAVIRAADALRVKYGDGLGYLQDPDYLPGRQRPTSGPQAPAGGSSPSPAPRAPDAPEGAPTASPEAPGSITQAAPDAPEPITPAAPKVSEEAPRASDETGIDPEAPKGTARDYFGRKSFGGQGAARVAQGGPEGVPNAPEVAPTTNAGAAPEKVAPASDGPPSRTDLRRALQGYVKAAEALAEGNPALAEAVAQARRYLDGASMGSEAGFQKKYLDGLQRLSRALEDAESDAADKLLASVIDDLDSGFGSKLPKGDDLMASRRGSPEDAARLERGRAMGFDVDTPVYRGLQEAYTEREAGLSAQWFTTSPEDAGDYASVLSPDIPGANVVPAFIRRGKNLKIEADGAMWTRLANGIIPPDIHALLPAKADGSLWSHYRTNDIVKAAKEAGYDSVTFADVMDPAGGGGQRLDGTDAQPETVEVVFDPSNIRATWAKFDEDGMDLLASRAGGLERAAEAERVRDERAEIYDAVQAAFSFGQGPYKKPSIGATAAVGGAGAAAAAAAVAIYEDAPDEVKAGITALAAGIGLAAGAAVGKGRVRKWENNTPSLGIFAGPTAKGVSLKDLQKAQKMEKAGTDRDVIWKKTGWGRMGPSGEWITEIRDPMAGLNDMLTDLKVRLGEVLDAPKIMRAYADLHEVRMQTGEMLRYIYDTSADGAANLSDKTLAVRMDMNRASQLRVAIHEINHLIQGQRKRQVPGNSEMDDRAAEAVDALKPLMDEYDDLFFQISDGMPKGPEKDAALARMDELAQQIDELNPASKEYYQYLTLDLEAESRLVETRLGMTAQQARDRPPWYDLDVEENDLWMARQMGRYAASLGSDLKAFRDQKWWDENVTEVAVDGSPGYRIDNLSKDGDGVVIYFSDIGDGYAERTWDWTSNVDNGQDLEVLSKSPADAARAYAATIAVTERALASGKYKAINVQGLKKANPGKDMSGHEKTIMRTLSMLNQEGYRLSRASWQSKVRVVDEETKNVSMVEVTRSSFVLSKEDIELDEVWKNIMGRKVDIEEVPLAPKREQQLAASRGPTGPRQEASQAAPEPDDGYRGLEEWRDVNPDDGYQPRQFNMEGFRRVIASMDFRNNPTRLGNRFGDLFLRSDPQRYDELAQRLGISAQEAAWRTGRKYIDTLVELMNAAGDKGKKATRINPADREAAKETVRLLMNNGNPFDETSEDALELLLDLVAPVRKASAESPRARPRMNYKLSRELDADIEDMFEWNAEKLFVSYSRHISGYAGLLRAGYRSVAELDNEIKQIRDNAKFDTTSRARRAGREADLLVAMRDAILGVPPKEDLARPEWQFVVNQIRRMNFGNLMNNVGFLALSEVAGALTRVNAVKMFTLFPEYQKYIRLARAGDPRAQENVFYLADVTMGHGSAQLRSRVGSVEDRASGEAPSLEDPTNGVMDNIDRFTRKQANAVARFSGMAPIQEWLRMTIVTAEAQDWVKAARNGKPPYEARRMAQMGIDAPMWQRISGELRRWGDVNSPDTRRPVPNMDIAAWEDGEALNFFINALDRNANRIVMEGDLGHTALFLRNKPSAGLFFQFLNFPLNAFSKHLGFAAKTKDARAAAEMLTMMLGGAAGYVARTMAQAGVQDTEEERQKILDERLTDAEIGKALLYYSAHGSVIPNVVDLGLFMGQEAGIPNPLPGYEGETVQPVFSKTRASGLPGNPITGNPTISRINQLPKTVGDFATGTPFSEQDVQGAIKALAPFGNHIAVTALLDRMLEFLPDEEDSIEAEVQQ